MNVLRFQSIQFYCSLWMTLFATVWGMFFFDFLNSNSITAFLNMIILIFGGMLLLKPSLLTLEGELREPAKSIFAFSFFVDCFLTLLLIYESGYIAP